MAKIRLGQRPKTFRAKVKVVLLDGEEGEVELVFRYRTRTEFGELLDQLFTEAKVAPPATDAESVQLSLAQALAATRDSNADYILRIAEGWDLEHEFSRANIAQLCDELPGVAMAIMERYRSAINEGRLGN